MPNLGFKKLLCHKLFEIIFSQYDSLKSLINLDGLGEYIVYEYILHSSMLLNVVQ